MSSRARVEDDPSWRVTYGRFEIERAGAGGALLIKLQVVIAGARCDPRQMAVAHDAERGFQARREGGIVIHD